MAKKAEAPIKEAKVAVPKETRKTVESMLAKLVEHYGPHIFPDERDLVDHLVFAILADHAPVTNARKAIRDLREVYVDWNETRVASARELADRLEVHRFADPFACAKSLRQSLQGVFDALYTLDVGVLAEPDSERGKGAKKRLDKATTVPGYLRDYLLLLAGVSDQAPLGPSSALVLTRVGLFAADDPDTKKRGVLGCLADRTEALRLHHVVVEHVKKLCTDADPKCPRCPLQKDCRFASDQEQARKARPKTPAAGAEGRPASAAASGRQRAEAGKAKSKPKPKPKATAGAAAKDRAEGPARARRSKGG